MSSARFFVLFYCVLLPFALFSQDPFAGLNADMREQLQSIAEPEEQLEYLQSQIKDWNPKDTELTQRILPVAISLAQKVQDQDTYLALLYTSGYSYNRQNKKDSARQILKEVILLAEKSENQVTKINALRQYARTFNNHSHKDSTLIYYHLALAAAEEAEESLKRFALYNDIGLTHMHNAEYVEAEESFLKAVALHSEVGNPRYLAGMYHNLGNNASGANDQDKAIAYYEQAYQIVKEIGDVGGEAVMLSLIAYHYMAKGYIPLSLEYYQKALHIADSLKENGLGTKVQCLKGIAQVHESMENHLEALPYYLQVYELADQNGLPASLNDIGENYRLRSIYDTAIIYFDRALDQPNPNKQLSYAKKGQSYIGLDQPDSAEYYLAMGLEEARKVKAFAIQSVCLTNLGLLALEKEQWKKAETFLKESIDIAETTGARDNQMDAAAGLYQLYKTRGPASQALHYHELYKTLEDSLFNLKNTERLVRLQADAEFEQEKQQIAFERERENNRQAALRRTMMIALSGAVLIMLVIAWYYWQKRKANEKLQSLNGQLENTLDTLQTTQEQLIMQEKMASLGQMTAGIAHEIKNPLNFVNNFSRLIVQLADEFKEDFDQFQQTQDPEDWETLQETLTELKDNSDLVHKHGQRASSIVKGMMDHAREYQGERISTDINAVVRESVNLADKAFSSQEKGFSIDIEWNLDDSLPILPMNPQDLRRVIINLVNNASYALVQKRKDVGQDFQPRLLIQTSQKNGDIQIGIEDNGPGIPEDIREKIFTPFFTTKPTGKGSVGLGLSISFDIINQGYQGMLTCSSSPGEFTRFDIHLPTQS